MFFWLFELHHCRSVLHVSPFENNAHEQCLWMNNCQFCLNCLFKIREMANNVLRLYFPWPLPSVILKDVSTDSAECQLLDIALRHCNNTRPRQCDSGALLCTLIFTGLACLHVIFTSVLLTFDVRRKISVSKKRTANACTFKRKLKNYLIHCAN